MPTTHRARRDGPLPKRSIVAVSSVVAALAATTALALLPAEATEVPGAPTVAGQSTVCTRILEGTEWTLDPCVPEGEPLPQDIEDTLRQVREERVPAPSDSPSPTEPPLPTESPSPTGVPSSPPVPPIPTFTTTPSGSPSTPSESPSSPPEECVKLDGKPLEDAKKDRIKCRALKNLPDAGKAVVLTATGDSVTSAHFQFGFGAGVCEKTSHDGRNLDGNDAVFSYAGRYYEAEPNVIDYHNMARTVFSTTRMLSAAAGDTDACGNKWDRAVPPVDLAAARIAKAKADGHKAYHVTTGGVNNTNWSPLLAQVIKCRAMEFGINAVPGASFSWAGVGGRNGIVPNGGGCVARFTNPFPFTPDWFHRIGVPKFNGADQSKAITDGVKETVKKITDAGADKLVWMLYYDISAANIDIGNAGWSYLRSVAPQWIVDLLPPKVEPHVEPLIDPGWVGATRRIIQQLNTDIAAGLPADNPKVKAQAAPIFLARDMQETALGGSPHPSADGQKKLAAELRKAFAAIQ
jgi:hypothetical protein